MLQTVFFANILTSLVIILIGVAFEFNNIVVFLMAVGCLLLALLIKWLTTAQSEYFAVAASYFGVLSFYSIPLYYLAYLTGGQQNFFLVISSLATAGLALCAVIFSTKKRIEEILQMSFVAFPPFGVFVLLFGQEDISVPLIGTLCFGLLQGLVAYRLKPRPA